MARVGAGLGSSLTSTLDLFQVSDSRFFTGSSVEFCKWDIYLQIVNESGRNSILRLTMKRFNDQYSTVTVNNISNWSELNDEMLK